MRRKQHACKPNIGTGLEASPARRFINESQLSELTGVAVGTWQKKRVLGGGPPYRKIGGAVRYDLAEVLLWIDAAKRGGSDGRGAAA